MEDFTNALAYEVKQEIASRYFGFRKQIESATMQYMANLEEAKATQLQEVKINLQRMQCLLASEGIYTSFLAGIGLPAIVANEFARYQPERRWQDIGCDLKGEGFTRRRRYNNLVYTTYKLLADSLTRYRAVFIELSEEHEDISMQIKQFYRNNDLTGILTFLRRIDNPEVESFAALPPEPLPENKRSFEQDMRIHPPPPVSDQLIDLPEIEPLKTAKSTLNRIIDRAYPFVRDNTANILPI